MRELERRVLLSVLDRKWREHLYEMDYLREGIYLRAYSQRDPLVEYQREGFEMFATMMDGIKEEAVGFLFNLEVSGRGRRRRGGGRGRGADAPRDRRLVPRTTSPTTGSPPARPSSPTRSRVPAAAFVRQPQIRAKGLQPSRQPQKLSYSAPSEDGEAEVKGRTVTNGRRPVRQGGPQRAVPLRLGQEVQDVPRPARGPDRPDRARRRRLTGRTSTTYDGASTKTSLLWLMAGALEPDRGRVHVDGSPVGDRPEAAARGVAVVPQGNGLAAVLTAYENIVVPLLDGGVSSGEADSRAREALEVVGLGSGRSTWWRSSPAASSSGLRWPARSRPGRRCCWPTSRPATSTAATARWC